MREDKINNICTENQIQERTWDYNGERSKAESEGIAVISQAVTPHVTFILPVDTAKLRQLVLECHQITERTQTALQEPDILAHQQQLCMQVNLMCFIVRKLTDCMFTRKLKVYEDSRDDIKH